MNVPSQKILNILLFVTGLVLIVGGVAAGKPGAWIIGLIVAAVNAQQWLQMRSQAVQ